MQLMMGALFGILGLALADPMLAMLKVLLERLAARDAIAHDGDGIDRAGVGPPWRESFSMALQWWCL
jgi:hypothetical protein